MNLFWAVGLFAVGAVAGVLGGLLGVGGGILIVPVLLWVLPHLGADPLHAGHYAVASSLLPVLATQAAGAWAHGREKRVVFRLVLWAGPPAAAAGWLGAAVAARLPGPWLSRIFGVLLLAVAAQLLLSRAGLQKDSGARTEAAQGKAVPCALCVVGGLGVGFAAGLLGIGGGIVAVPYFHLVLGLGMRSAMATALPVGLFGAALGIARHLLSAPGGAALSHSTGYVYWPAALSLSLGALPGSPLGAWLAARADPLWLRRIFAVLMAAAGVELLSK